MLRINYNYFLTIVISSLFIFSINVNPNRLFDDNPSILNYIRFFFPILGIIFILFFYKLNLSKLSSSRLDLSFENKIIFFIFIIFLLNDLFNGITANSLYYLNFFSFFLYVLLIKSFNDPKLLKFNFHYLIGGYLISVIFLIAYKFFNSSISLYNQFDVLIFDFFDLRNFAVFNETETGLSNNPSINSTGFSRVVLILAVILIYYDLTKKNISIILTIILFCLSLILISLQSKFSILSALIIYILLLCSENTYRSKKVLNFVFVILLPVLYFNLSTIDRENRINATIKVIIDEQVKVIKPIIKQEENENTTEDENTEKVIIENSTKKIKKKYHQDINTQITTGRNRIWRDQINYINSNNILFKGKGIYADLKIFGTSSSNAILYTFLCGGLVGAILLIIFYIKFIIQFFVYIYKKTFNIKQNISEIYFFILLILLLRSLVENSFMSIQFDFYLTIILIEILNLRKKSKKLIN